MSPIFQTIFLVGTFFAASYKQDDSSLSQFSLVGFFFEGTRENILPIFRAPATGEQIELFPTWRDVDDRFFFNRAMVEELIEIGDQKLDAWITPFIQVCTKILLCKQNLMKELKGWLLILLRLFKKRYLNSANYMVRSGSKIKQFTLNSGARMSKIL